MAKKLTLVLSLVLAVVMSFGIFAACNPEQKPDDYKPNNPTKEKVVLWVSNTAGVKEQFEAQIAEFAKTNPDMANYEFVVEGVGEDNSATNMLKDVETGADIYCFAQDQLARLVEAKALNKLGEAATKFVTDNNSADSAGVAKVGADTYCYPLTADNGYFMYYDKRDIQDTSIDSLESILADCKTAGKNFAFEAKTSAWYIASLFFGAGCHSSWTMNSDGSFNAVDDNFNSEAGMAAMRALGKIGASEVLDSTSGAAAFSAATPAAVLISGTWAYADVVKALGEENVGIADLPSWTDDDKTYHMGSFSGYKLLGVKPQADAKKGALLHKLAQYLTSETCQMQRFEEFSWGPSNKNAQNNEAVKASPALSALIQQNQYAVVQGQIHGSWWDICKALGVAGCEATTDEARQAALETYEDAIKALFSMSDEEKNAWSLIGSIAESGWNIDLEMKEDPAGTWTTTQSYTFDDTVAFKIRQGKSWDNQISNAGNNFKASEVTGYTAAGKYFVKVVIATGEVTLIPDTAA